MTSERALPAVLLAFGAGQLALGLFIALFPGAFADSLGAFEGRSDHLARDSATIYFALGFGLIMAARRPSWRVPVLAVATVQYVVHAINHAIDVGESDPEWIGPADLVALVAGAALLAWLWSAAQRDGA